jgi:hypothetical protein
MSASRLSARWPFPCSGVISSWPSKWALRSFRLSSSLAAEPGLSANALPLLLVVGAAFAFAVSNVLTKRYGPFDPLIVGGLLAISGVAITQVRPSARPI